MWPFSSRKTKAVPSPSPAPKPIPAPIKRTARDSVLAGEQPLPLSQLEPMFITRMRNGHQRVPTIAEADGIEFLCPKCYLKNGGRIGTHQIICWRPGRVADDVRPKGRWDLIGTGLTTVSLVATKGNSVQILGGCNAHFFVEHGRVRPAGSKGWEIK